MKLIKYIQVHRNLSQKKEANILHPVNIQSVFWYWFESIYFWWS